MGSRIMFQTEKLHFLMRSMKLQFEQTKLILAPNALKETTLERAAF